MEQKNKHAQLLKWGLTLATIAWFLLMLFLSQESADSSGVVTGQIAQQISQSSGQTENLGYWDKVIFTNKIHHLVRSWAHVAVFFVLAVLLVLTVHAWQGRQLWSLAFLCLWSVLDEVLKLWALGRHCDPVDIGKNLAGVIAGWLFARFLIRIGESWLQPGRKERHGTDQG